MSGAVARSWHRLRYFCADAWDECRHSPGVNVLALATLASVLFLAALVTLVVENLAQRIERTGENVGVHVFLHDLIDEAARMRLEGLLEGEPGVVRVEYVDKAQALRDYRAWAPEMAHLADELQVNPLPASLAVSLAQGADTDAVAQAIEARFADEPGVESIRYDRALAGQFEALMRLARFGGVGVGALVFVAVAFVMASVLRLAVYARRDEIEIMLLVGATPSFVRGPFLVAGLVQGFLAALVALGAVEALRRLMLTRVGSGALGLVDLIAAEPLSWPVVAVAVAAGMAVAGVGSWFAVRRSALSG